jgi:hypothetical protein
MTEFEQTLLREISTLPEARRADVLAFVRYLKLSIPDEEAKIEKRFDKSLKSIRTRAKKINITQEDIDAEINAVRAEHARRD